MIDQNLNEHQAVSPFNSYKERDSKLENITYYILLAIVFLLPIFFIPNALFSFQFGKIILISLGSLLSLSLLIVSRLKLGSIELPKGLVFFSVILILLINLISIFMSGSIMESFIGIGLETDTLFFVLMLFILLFTSFKIFNSTQKILTFYISLFASSALLLVYHLSRIFVGPNFLSFGILTSPTSNLLGSWNDLSVLFGLLVLVSVTTLEFLKPTKVLKSLLYIFTILSLIFIIFVNSLMTWLVLALLSLLLFVYLYFQNIKNNQNGLSGKRFSNLSVAVFIISVIFIILRPQVGEFVTNKYGISQIEARPSLASTFEMAKNVLAENPGFGVGPNRFNIEWGNNKPLSVNNTIFWNVDFNYGVGIIPTYLVTNGILGFLAWITFLGSLLVLGVKTLFVAIEDKNLRFITTSSFAGTIYLWIFAIFSIPNVVIYSLGFLMTGVFLASASKVGLLKHKEISFSDDSKTSFASVFALIIILIINISLLYMIGARYASSIYVQKAVILVNQRADLDKGLENMNKALSLVKTDDSYRLMSQLHIARLNKLLNEEDVSKTQEGLNKFQEMLGAAISNSQLAISLDEADYKNWMSLGAIYEAIIPLGINGAYENAKQTYEKALVANPTNPSIDLSLARVEVLKGDSDAARVMINKSLGKKNNYTSAIFLLSQIEINEGNINEAIKAVEAASLIDPNDPLTFFQLGFLKFNQKDFTGAVNALERAVILNPPYSNAKYFLGLSYYSLNRPEEAIAQFEDIELLNPDNKEVKLILENLRAGKNPLLNVEGSQTETTEELPLQES